MPVFIVLFSKNLFVFVFQRCTETFEFEPWCWNSNTIRPKEVNQNLFDDELNFPELICFHQLN